MLSMRESSDAIEGVCGCGLKVGSDRMCRDHNARWLLAQRYHDTEKNLKSTSATPPPHNVRKCQAVGQTEQGFVTLHGTLRSTSIQFHNIWYFIWITIYGPLLCILGTS
jgi:hypothetical protein